MDSVLSVLSSFLIGVFFAACLFGFIALLIMLGKGAILIVFGLVVIFTLFVIGEFVRDVLR